MYWYCPVHFGVSQLVCYSHVLLELAIWVLFAYYSRISKRFFLIKKFYSRLSWIIQKNLYFWQIKNGNYLDEWLSGLKIVLLGCEESCYFFLKKLSSSLWWFFISVYKGNSVQYTQVIISQFYNLSACLKAWVPCYFFFSLCLIGR